MDIPKYPTFHQRLTALLVCCLVLSSCDKSGADKGTPATRSPKPSAPPAAKPAAPADVKPTKPARPTPEADKPAPGVVRLRGAPEDIGRQHGALLKDKIRVMIGEYVEESYGWETRKDALLERVRAMKPSLPDWYRTELAACAKAAGIDEDILLYAQCEGDIRSLGGCTAYVAFGAATHDGRVEIGRSFDYWGLESTDACVMVFAVIPRREDGYAFVSVGWAGILGGWTFVNEKGLFVANNLGGFSEKNPKGVPTLILERIIAQKAATVDEAIKIIQQTPRMRGQALVIGQAGDAKAGVLPDAAAVQYDAVRVEVERQTDGFVLDSSVGTSAERLREMLRQPGRRATDVIHSAGNYITLHSVAIRPQEHRIWVAHGRRSSAHLGGYVEHNIQSLLRR